MILYSGQLYRLLSRPLKIFERRNPYREAAIDTVGEEGAVDVILSGLGNYGSGLMEYLLRREKVVLGVDYDPGALSRWRKRGIPVVYGDMSDPEIHEHLPLNKARWVISTVRSKEMNLTLINNLKTHLYSGKVALTAINEEEALEYEKAGAHLVFRPFRDAAEQAADTLAYAIDFLPEEIDWPVSFLEVRIRSGSSVAGKTLRDLSLSASGTSVMAVSRGGRVFYEPEPGFRIFPSDILLLIGSPAGLKEAEQTLNQLEMHKNIESSDRFEIAEIRIADDSPVSGQTLANIQFRQKYGVTLVGIRRGPNQITTINPTERLMAGDCLIVLGNEGAVRDLKAREPI